MIARLGGSRELAPNTRHFDFIAEGGDFRFTPGQFVSLVHNDVTRAYSIASPPDGNQFSLCANLVTDGLFTPHLFAMQPGDAVQLNGPLGTFVLRPSPVDSLLVATGTGIAPFRSMVNSSAAGFRLIFGVRHQESLLYDAEWRALAASRANFEYLPTLTRPPESWTGLAGRVHDHVLAAVGDRRDIDIYICGLREMVDELRARLKAIGYDRKRIVYERYD